MKKVITFLLSGVLIVGAVGCENAAKTNVESPNTTNETVKRRMPRRLSKPK